MPEAAAQPRADDAASAMVLQHVLRRFARSAGVHNLSLRSKWQLLGIEI
jgi:hypothetical protein